MIPRRPEHMIGLCYPDGGGATSTLRPYAEWLNLWSLLGLTALRVNAHHARPDIFEFLQFIADSGLRPWPIIDLTTPRSNADANAVLDRELPSIMQFVSDLGRFAPWITEIEVGNEPLSMTRFGPQEYARLCIAVGETMRDVNPDCRIYIASEHLSADGSVHAHWTQTAQRVPLDLYDGVAIHSYRPLANHSGFGTRRQEFDTWCDAVHPDKEIVCTETGYKADALGEVRQGDELYAELEIQRALAITATFIYAHVGSVGMVNDFGIFRDAESGSAEIHPRPAALRVAEFCEKYREITR